MACQPASTPATPVDIPTAAAHVANAAREHPDAAFDIYVQTCHMLPPSLRPSDLVSALPPLARRHLERSGMRPFRTRALSELRGAARAWDVSPLLLLAQFSDAPRSDHFWRRLSLLARRGQKGAWPTECTKLDAARHRRQNDMLARRKGVSRTQPWTLADVEDVLRQKNADEEEEAGRATRLETLDTSASETSPKLPELGVDNERFRQRFIWPMSIGWWITRDAMRRLCILLAPLGTEFSAVDVPSAVVLASVTTLVIPVQVRLPQHHWVLGVVSRTEDAPETTIWLYDPQSLNKATLLSDEAMLYVMSTAAHVWPDMQASSATIAMTDSAPQQQQTGMNSGVAVLVGILSIICCPTDHSHPVPCRMMRDIDTWLWRRLFSCYFAQALHDDREVEVATVMSTDHTVMLLGDSRKRLDALHTDVVEARAIWEVAVTMAVISGNDTQHAIRAVLKDIDQLTAWLANRKS